MDKAKPLLNQVSPPQAVTKSFLQNLLSPLVPIAKRILINEIVNNHAVHIRAAAESAVHVFMETSTVPNHLPIPKIGGVQPITNTHDFPRSGTEIPMSTTATIAPVQTPKSSILSQATAAIKTGESWLEKVGKAIASDIPKIDIVLKNTIPVAQLAATIFSFTPWGAAASEVVQLIIMAEGFFAAAGQQSGTGQQKAATVVNSIGGLIEAAFTAFGAPVVAEQVKGVIDTLVKWLNSITPQMIQSLEKALTGNLLIA